MKRLVAMLGGLAVSVMALAGPVNVNTADAETISRELKGVGQAKAEAIVAYRNQHGAYKVPEDLLQVKGIGTRVLIDNADNIMVE